MPRRGRVPRRATTPDPLHNSELVAKFTNKLMLDGEKSIARGILYGAFEIMKQKTGKPPVEVFEQAIKNVMPVLEVKPRRVGGATYQVPIEVRADRKMALAFRWIVQYARARNERTMTERLAAELMEAATNTGGAIKKREDTHRMAEANKAFAHFRW